MTTNVADFDDGPGGRVHVASNFDPPQAMPARDHAEIDHAAIEVAS